MTIENTDSLELKDRYETLIQKYIEIIPALTKQLEEFGRLRNELQLISVELVKRNISLEDIDKKYEQETSQDNAIRDEKSG